MINRSGLRFTLPIFLLTLSLSSYSSIYDYIYPDKNPSFSNFGGIGLLKNPTARFYEEGTLAVSWTHDYPYLRGSIIAYPFNWMEASFQYTDINNQLYSLNPAFSGSQSLKDKSFDAKFRIMKENQLLPEIAVGFRDIGGTGLFESEYIVASKFLGNFDFTLGLGWGNLAKHTITNPFEIFGERFKSRQSNVSSQGGELNLKSFFTGKPGIFGGVEYFFPNMNGLRLKIELDGTNYNVEGPEILKQSNPLNMSIVFPRSNFQWKISYMQGNKLSFGFSYALKLGKRDAGVKKVSKYVPVENSEIVKKVVTRDKSLLYQGTLRYMGDRDLFLQMANLDEKNKTYSVAFSEAQHISYPIPLGRTLRILNDITPDNVENFEVMYLNARLGTYKLRVAREDLDWSINKSDSLLLFDNIELSPYKLVEEDFQYRPPRKLPAFFYSVSPDLRSQIGGPDGFFFGDLRIAIDGELIPANRTSIIFQSSIGITDNMDVLTSSPNSVLPHVRTEIVDYLKNSRDFAIDRFQLNYYYQPKEEIYTKFSFGLLESMFGGYGGEILYRPFYKDYAVGLDVWHVKQRSYEQKFEFFDYSTVTGHLSFYYKEPKTKVLLKVSGGKYLAKDSGFTFDFSRRFKSGLMMGAFFSLTDISSEEFGEGSFDKGFYFWVPIQIFSSNYQKPMRGWGLRPITRDGAAILTQSYHLYGVTDQSSYWNLERDWHDFYK